MTVGYPPNPVYPFAIDNDFTLFLVYNTTEAKLTADNPAWSEDIEISPVKPGETEIWSTNGFANIEGELLYYDSVETDSNGKIYKLKRCARNLGGKKTHFVPAGKYVRGFVVAEHHNQLVDAILNVEEFIGFQFNTDIETLDWRIRNLEEVPIIFDDHLCPDITFTFNIESGNEATGYTAAFLVEIQGTFQEYKLDFGDGTFTTTELEGTHFYATNRLANPVLIVKNGKCEIIQSPGNYEEPPPDEDFIIPIPDIPPIPSLVVPSICEDITVETRIPPIVFPCLDIGPIDLSVISIDIDLDIPQLTPFSVIGPTFTPISITGPEFTPISVIGPTFSPISITGPTFTPISITGPTFTPISITGAPSFSPIGFGPAPSFSPIGFGPAPSFSPIGFGPAPSFSPIGFGPAPSFSPIGFGPAPSFSPIGFGPAPSFTPIGFGPAPSLSPIGFGPAPSLTPIGFGPAPSLTPIGFGPAPSLTPIGFGPAPKFSPIGFGPAPEFTPIGFGPAPDFSPIGFGPAPDFSPIGFGPAPDFSPIGFRPCA